MLPHNAVEYFVSYYDYYQPEAYIAQTDTYIEKDSLDQRRRRTAAPFGDLEPAVAARRGGGGLGVCIYGLGTRRSPAADRSGGTDGGDEVPRDGLLILLVDRCSTTATTWNVHARHRSGCAGTP